MHELTVQAAVLLAALGLAVGAFGTVVGVGGGFILTPLLLLLYPNESPKTITAIGLVAVFAAPHRCAPRARLPPRLDRVSLTPVPDDEKLPRGRA